jgi:hypothetical protein
VVSALSQVNLLDLLGVLILDSRFRGSSLDVNAQDHVKVKELLSLNVCNCDVISFILLFSRYIFNIVPRINHDRALSSVGTLGQLVSPGTRAVIGYLDLSWMNWFGFFWSLRLKDNAYFGTWHDCGFWRHHLSLSL